MLIYIHDYIIYFLRPVFWKIVFQITSTVVTKERYNLIFIVVVLNDSLYAPLNFPSMNVHSVYNVIFIMLSISMFRHVRLFIRALNV